MSSFTPEPDAPVISYPAEAGGTVTRVLECGKGDEVIVCLHGSGARADRWRHNLTGLAALGYHVFAIDFPGHGFAAKDARLQYDTPGFAAIVADFVSGLGSSPVILLGTSLGAHVAAWYACAEPSRVRSAVLVGALGLVPVHRDPSQTSSRVSDTSPDGIRGKLRMLMFNQELVTDAWVEEERRINSSPGATYALAELRRYLETAVNDDLVGEAYAARRIPTMLAWGKEDKWVAPQVAFEAAKLLPDSPLVFFKHAGHAPYLERPAVFNTIVSEFLRGPAQFGTGLRYL